MKLLRLEDRVLFEAAGAAEAVAAQEVAEQLAREAYGIDADGNFGGGDSGDAGDANGDGGNGGGAIIDYTQMSPRDLFTVATDLLMHNPNATAADHPALAEYERILSSPLPASFAESFNEMLQDGSEFSAQMKKILGEDGLAVNYSHHEIHEPLHENHTNFLAAESADDLPDDYNWEVVEDYTEDEIPHEEIVRNDTTSDSSTESDLSTDYADDADLDDDYDDDVVVIDGTEEIVSSQKSLVIINSSVLDADKIIAALGDNPNVEILRLESGSDALQQILDYLNSRATGVGGISHEEIVRNDTIFGTDGTVPSQYSSLQIVSHGNAGYFVLNGQVIDAAFLADAGNAEMLRAISAYFTNDADMLLYGCNLAGDSAGQDLVNQLSAITGMDVAASIDTTGAGGNWTLEYVVGTIETANIVVDGYDYSLDSFTITVTSNADAGADTLRAALASVVTGHDYIINFDIVGVDTITLSTALTFGVTGASITINGINADTGNKITISGNNADRVMAVGAGTVTLNDLTITQGKGAGGAGINISNTANVTINRCIFENNNTAAGNGAGINVFGGATATINDSIIRNNAADGANGGGGIHVNNTATVIINNSTISGNSNTNAGATSGGGGIRVTDCTLVEINNSTISGNTASQLGGGINFVAGTLNINNSTISGNIANGNVANAGGGGIYINNGTVNINASTISSNTANFTGSGSILNGGGGGIYINAGDVKITDSLISENKTPNVAASSYSGGGGIYLKSGTLTVDCSTISENSTRANNYVGGGGIYALAGTLNLSNSTIYGNVGGLGGGISVMTSVATGPTVNIVNCTITGNVAIGSTTAGGGIFSLCGVASTTGKFNVLNSIIIGNYAGTLASTVTASDITFFNNTTAPTMIMAYSVYGFVTNNTGGRLTSVAGNTQLYAVDSGSTQVNLSKIFAYVSADSTATSGGRVRANLTYSVGSDLTTIAKTATVALANTFWANTNGDGTNKSAFAAINANVLWYSATGATWARVDGVAGATAQTAISVDQRGFSTAGNSVGSYYLPTGASYATAVTIANDHIVDPYSATLRAALINLTLTGYAGTGAITFANGVNQNLSGQIDFGNLLTFGSGKYAYAASGFSLASQTVTITGNNTALDATQTIITADNNARVFNIGVAGNFTFNNLVITGGSITKAYSASNDLSIDAGGGINIANANVTLNGCEVTNNSVIVTGSWANGSLTKTHSAYGGGIYISSGSLTVEDTTISNNSVTLTVNVTGAGTRVLNASGGGIYVAGGTVEIKNNSTISDNSVSAAITGSAGTNNLNANGGGIYNAGTLTIDNSTISDNTASADGGGMFIGGGAVTITGSTISDNQSNRYGGGLLVNAGTIEITNTDFTGNSAMFGAGIMTFTGVSTVTITGGNISNNTSSNNGGGLYIGGTGVSEFTINGTTIDNNTTAASGGGMFINAGTISINNAAISGNKATTSGGGIHIVTGTITIDKSTISGNTAVNGGGIYIANSSATGVTITDSTISGNKAGGNTSANLGGGIHIANGTVKITDSTITGNSTTSNSNSVDRGGGIYIATTSATGVTITRTTISDNTMSVSGTGQTSGGGIYILAGTVKISDALIIDNKVTRSTGSTGTVTGGGIHIAAGNVTIESTTISGNSLATSYNTSAASYTLTTHGGGIYIGGGTIIINDSLIDNNSVLAASSGPYTSTRTHNAYGGGIYLQGAGTVTLNNTVISNNTASGTSAGSAGTNTINAYGGGIYAGGTGTLTLNNSAISNNTVSAVNGRGGASTITTRGGGIHINSGTVTINTTTIQGNTAGANSSGGGVSVAGVTVNINNSTISGNSAAVNGGGIYVTGGTANLNNSTLYNNTAVTGGGIYVSGGITNVVNTTITANRGTHATDGGGIYVATGATLNLLNSIIVGNYGGAASLAFDLNGDGVGIINMAYSVYGYLETATLTLGVNNTQLYNTQVDGATAQTAMKNELLKVFAYVASDGTRWNAELTYSVKGVAGVATNNANNTATLALAKDFWTNTNANSAYAALVSNVLYYSATNAANSWVRVDGTVGNSTQTAITIDQRGISFNPAQKPSAIGSYWLATNATYKNLNSSIVTTAADDPYYHGISLRDALYFASTQSGNTVITFSNTIFSTPTTITLIGEFKFSAITHYVVNTFSLAGKTFTIDGGDSLITLQAAGNARVFNIDVAGIYTIKNLTLNGAGTVNGTGGAIYIGNAGSNVTLDTVAIRGFSATSGGGIYIAAGNVIINNSVISNNIGTANGGGIFITTGNVTVNNSTISENKTTASGSNGGGIYITNGNVTINNSTISNNAVTGTAVASNAGGGGIFALGSGVLNIINSTISGNSANIGGAIGSYSGATITINIINSTITGNIGYSSAAANKAGGIFFNNASGAVNIVNSIVIGNYDSAGNAADLARSGGTINIANSIYGNIINGGTVTDKGGNTRPYNSAINTADMKIELEKVFVSVSQKPIGANNNNLYAANLTKAVGEITETLTIKTAVNGGIAATGTHTAISGNVALYYDGVWKVVSTGVAANATQLADARWICTDQRGGFLSNAPSIGSYSLNATQHFADVNGEITVNSNDQTLLAGGVGNSFNPTDYANNIMYKSDMTLAKALLYVGANYGNFTINFSPTVFPPNTSITLNAEIKTSNFLANGRNFTIDGGLEFVTVGGIKYATSVLTLNAASGARIFNLDTAVNLTISNVKMLGHISKTAVVGNGGALSFTIANTNLILSNVEIANFTSTISGGALYGENGTLTISRGKFHNNIAHDGGAIYLKNAGASSIFQSLIIDNQAKNTSGGGGAISLTGTSSLAIDESLIENNSAANGGAIRLENTASLIVNNSAFSHNQASSAGGAIIAAGTGIIRIEDTTFVDNVAKTNGGAIALSGATTMTLNNSLLIRNKATTDGGAIFINAAAMLTITNSTLMNNSAGSNGGAIRVNSTPTVNLVNTTISGNTAAIGGAIQTSSGNTLNIANCTITGNLATSNGGGISRGNGTYNILNSIIVGNYHNANVNDMDLATGTTHIAYSVYGVITGTVQTLTTNVQNTKLTTTDMAVELPNIFAYVSQKTIGAQNLWAADLTYSIGDLTLKTIAKTPTICLAQSFWTNIGGVKSAYAAIDTNNVLVYKVNAGDNWAAVNNTKTYSGTNAITITTDQRGISHLGVGGNTSVMGVGSYWLATNAATVKETAGLVVTTNEDIVDLYDGQISLREALYYLASGTNGNITFNVVNFAGADKNLIQVKGGEIVFANVVGGKSLSGKEVIIDGANKITIQSVNSNNSRLFNVNAAVDDFTMKNLTLKGLGAESIGIGKTNANGGAMQINHANAKVTIDNLTINGFVADNNGGAIAILAGTLNVNDSTFYDNTAKNGGAIAILGGELNLDNSTLYNNTATNNGGAIYVLGNAVINSIRVNIINTTISSNTANQGGGIYIDGAVNDSVRVNLANCTIVGNLVSSAINGGGGIYVIDAINDVNVANSIIVGNYNSTTNKTDDLKTNNTSTNMNLAYSIYGTADSITNRFGGSSTQLYTSALNADSDAIRDKLKLVFAGVTEIDERYVVTFSSGEFDKTFTLALVSGSLAQRFGTQVAIDKVGAVYELRGLDSAGVWRTVHNGNTTSAGVKVIDEDQRGILYNTGNGRISIGSYFRATYDVIVASADNVITVTNKEYNGNTTANGTTTTGAVNKNLNGDTITITGTGGAMTGNYHDKNVNADQDNMIAISGGVTVSVSSATDRDVGDYEIKINGKNTITAKELTVNGITASDKVYDGTGAANLNTESATTSGKIGADVVNLVVTGATGTFSDVNASAGKTVTINGLTLSGADAGNYKLATTITTTNTAEITKRAITVSAHDQTIRTTTGTPNYTDYHIENGSLVAGDILGGNLAFDGYVNNIAENSIVGYTILGTNITVTSTGDNYAIAFDGGKLFVVGKDILLVTVTVNNATDKTKVYGQSEPTWNDTTTFTYTFWKLNGATWENVGTSATITVTGMVARETGTNVGEYDFKLGTLALNDATYTALNYALQISDGSTVGVTKSDIFTITKAQVTITVIATSKTYGEAPVTINYTAQVTGKGDVGLYGVDNFGSTKLSRVAGENAGTYNVTIGNLSAGGNYEIVTTLVNATNAYTITKRDLVVTAITVEGDVHYNGAIQSATVNSYTVAAKAGITGLIDGDAANITFTAQFADKDAGTNRLITVNSSVSDNANYNVVLIGGINLNVGEIDKAHIAITVDEGQSKIYNDADGTFTYAVTGLFGGDTVTGNLSRVAGTDVGVYAINNYAGLIVGGNYEIHEFNGANYTITPKTLTIASITITGKTYDGNTSATIGAVTFNEGVIANVALSTSTTANFADKNANTNIAVSISGATLSGTAAHNYQLDLSTLPAITGTITARVITAGDITMAIYDKTYDGNDSATINANNTTINNVVGGDKITLTATTATFADKNANVNKTVTITGLSLSGDDAGNYQLAGGLTSLTSTATINKATLTVSGLEVKDKIYNGDDVATVIKDDEHFELVGVIEGDDVDLDSDNISAKFANKNVGTNKTVTINGLTLSGDDVDNYDFVVTGSFTANITQAKLTVSGLTAQDREYNGYDNATITGTATITGKFGADVVNLSGTANGTFDSGKNVGVNKNVTVGGLWLTGADANNYYFEYAASNDFTANITAKNIIVTADAQTQIYGDGAKNLTYTHNGLVGDDTASVFTGNLSRVAGNDVNDYAIGAGNLNAGGNYTISFNPANYEITKRAITVTANNTQKTVGGTDPQTFDFTVGGSGLANGETKAGVFNGALVREVGETIGEYGITQGNLAANSNYLITLFTDGVFKVVAAPVPPNPNPYVPPYIPPVYNNDSKNDNNISASDIYLASASSPYYRPMNGSYDYLYEIPHLAANAIALPTFSARVEMPSHRNPMQGIYSANRGIQPMLTLLERILPMNSSVTNGERTVPSVMNGTHRLDVNINEFSDDIKIEGGEEIHWDRLRNINPLPHLTNPDEYAMIDAGDNDEILGGHGSVRADGDGKASPSRSIYDLSNDEIAALEPEQIDPELYAALGAIKPNMELYNQIYGIANVFKTDFDRQFDKMMAGIL